MNVIAEALVFCLKQKAHYEKYPPEDPTMVLHLDNVIDRLKRVMQMGAA